MDLPRTMHAVVLTGHGGLDRLEFRIDVPIPTPKANEVLIEIAACGINNTDINTRTGWYASKVNTELTKDIGLNGAPIMVGIASSRFPRIQGADAVGVIVGVGSAVAKSRIGDRVIVDPCVRDQRLPKTAQGVSYFGTERDGGFAQYATIPSENAWAIKSNLDDVSLASFACSYSTAEEMLVRADLQAGETVVITGASGGVGTANIQLARLHQARVIAVAGREKEESLRAIGVDFFIPRQTPDLYRSIIDVVGRESVDVVADVTGGPAVKSLLRVLRRAGRFVTAGSIAGPVAEIDLRQVIYKDLEVFGVANPQAETFRRLIGYIERGQIKPLVSQTFELNELANAQRLFLEKAHIGKFVVKIKG